MVFTGPRLHIIMFSVVWCDTMYALYKSRHDKKFFGISDNVSPTQIGLFSQRRYIEALIVGYRNKREFINLCSENKGVDQLRGYHAADLRLFSRMQKAGIVIIWFIYNTACKTELPFKLAATVL